jgi:hypothetical protein
MPNRGIQVVDSLELMKTVRVGELLTISYCFIAFQLCACVVRPPMQRLSPGRPCDQTMMHGRKDIIVGLLGDSLAPKVLLVLVHRTHVNAIVEKTQLPHIEGFSSSQFG